MEERFLKFAMFSKFPEILHGISKRTYQNMAFSHAEKSQVIKNRQEFFNDFGIDLGEVIFPAMVHGGKVIKVSARDRGRGAADYATSLPEADGLITQEPGVFLAVTGADCYSVLFYDPIEQIVGITHAGWRGIISGIIGSMLEQFRALGIDLSNIMVGIGPGICQKHFVVNGETLAKFVEKYPQATLVRNHDAYVDLKKAIESDLLKEGISRENIETTKYCPSCQNGQFGSYRLEGNAAPKSVAFIGIKETK